MPTPSSSYEGITPLPPGVVSIRNGIFQPPDEVGLSVSVPTDYSLYTSSDAPVAGIGVNGDWYIYVASNLVRTYRKVINTWTLVSTISGGGGGGGVNSLNSLSGDLELVAGSGITIVPSGGDTLTITNTGGGGGGYDNIAITNSTFSSGDIDTTNINGGTLTSSAITTPAITGGTASGMAITGGTITGLPAPSANSDAATKQYVDGVAVGLTFKAPARVATTVNVSLAGGAPTVVDGVTLLVNDRVLVKDQSSNTQNGIYLVSTLGTGANGTWTRATDADTGAEMPTGTAIFVSAGTLNGSSTWVMNTPGAITIGVSPISWVLFNQVTTIPASSITGQIVGSQLADAFLTTAKFAASIRPIEIVSTMPSSDNGEGRTVYLTTVDGSFAADKIYRWTNPSVSTGTLYWTAAVPAVDITGNITNSQIADLAAAKLTGQITSTQITDGSISSPKIAAGAVIAGKIASNAVTANEIAAGSVTTGKLAAGSVTANELSANSVVAGKIAAAAVSTTELAAGAITSTKIASNSIFTYHIVAGEVQAANIAAGAVTAGKINVSTLSAINANMGTITAGTLTTSISISVGSGLGKVDISTSGLTVGSGRISMAGDGSNPWVRAYGAGGYASYYVEMNGSNGASAPRFTATSGIGGVTITPAAVAIANNCDIVVIGSDCAIKGSSGGQINLFGGSSDALDIVCGEQASEPTPDGSLLLKVNGRSVLVNFTNA